MEWHAYTCGDYIRRWRLHTRLCRDLFTCLTQLNKFARFASATEWWFDFGVSGTPRPTLRFFTAGASPPPYFNEILSDEIICDDEVFTTFRWSPALQGLLVCRLPTHSQKGASRPRMHFGTVYCIKPTIFCQYIFSFLLIFSENVMTVIHKIQQFFLKK